MADSGLKHPDSGQQCATPPTQAPVTQAFDKEAFLQRYAEAQAKFRQGNPAALDPGSNLSLPAEWWKPLGDLSIVMNAVSNCRY